MEHRDVFILESIIESCDKVVDAIKGIERNVSRVIQRTGSLRFLLSANWRKCKLPQRVI